ncbi:MAG: hypothetical protein IKR76_00495 [Ruminococcus sp.]|nr:hypothetical protein [Ruminococcus sp.]
MPSAIVHLKAAYDLANELGVKNYGQFYAGAVSPDAVNIDGFAPQSVRYPAHLRSLDYEQWKQIARDFCKAYKVLWKGREDFLKGFLLHIFTDIYWDEIAQPEMFEGFKKLGYKPEELRDVKWKELYRFNALLSGEWLYDEVLPKLKTAELYPIGTVDLERLTRYVADLTGDYQTRSVISEPTLVCHEGMVEKVEQKCKKELEALFNA